jgi:hypothetical protein
MTDIACTAATENHSTVSLNSGDYSAVFWDVILYILVER